VRCGLGRGDLLFRRLFLGSGQGSEVLEQEAIELKVGSLKMVWRLSCSALYVAT
jgi:hypothetical protein